MAVPVLAGWVYAFSGSYVQELPKAQPAVVLVLVQRLKVSSDRLGEAGNRTCDPWLTRHRFIPYTTAEIILAPLPAHQHSFLKSTIYPTVLLRIYGNKSLDCNCAYSEPALLAFNYCSLFITFTNILDPDQV